jgi:folate-binding protein YgfZ
MNGDTHVPESYQHGGRRGESAGMTEYAVIRGGAALGAVSARAAIAVSGTDRASYLQGLLTNDIPALVPGSGCYAAWLTPQGRMITDLHVLESGDMILLDVPADLADGILQRLDQFLFSEDVQLASLAGSLQSVWLHGPRAASTLQAVITGAPAFDEWAEYQHARLAFAGAPIVVARINQIGVPGYCAYVDPGHAEALRSALQANGAAAVSQAAIDAARIEAGYPVFGVDMTEDTIPLEAGIEGRAISLTKGCYVGQEVIIRVLHRGGGRVARRLVGLRLSGDAPARGAKVFAGDREIGFLTSTATSPALGAIALGYVHRDFTAPGTAVTAGEAHTMATVTTRPM